MFSGYGEALDELLRLGEERATAVIIDEFPYLVAATPAGRVGRPAKLLLFCLSGFSPELVTEAAGRPDVELIDLERLYRGS